MQLLNVYTHTYIHTYIYTDTLGRNNVSQNEQTNKFTSV